MIVKTYDCSIIIVGFLGRNFATWREKKGGMKLLQRILGENVPQIHHISRKKKVEIAIFRLQVLVSPKYITKKFTFPPDL